jgi:hypothetical protein
VGNKLQNKKALNAPIPMKEVTETTLGLLNIQKQTGSTQKKHLYNLGEALHF